MSTNYAHVQQLQKIVKFLEEHPTLESVNVFILAQENEARKAIQKVRTFADENNVTVNIEEAREIDNRIGLNSGIWGLQAQYQRHFNGYTARVEFWANLSYRVRETIGGYFEILRADIRGETVKVGEKGYSDIHDEIPLKKYQNGNAVFELTWEWRERIRLVQEIDKFFANRV